MTCPAVAYRGPVRQQWPLRRGANMRRLATIGTAFLSLAAFSGAANPADLPVKAHTKVPPVPAVYNWSGFYIGLNGGGASSHKCWTIFSNNNLRDGPTPEG